MCFYLVVYTSFPTIGVVGSVSPVVAPPDASGSKSQMVAPHSEFGARVQVTPGDLGSQVCSCWLPQRLGRGEVGLGGCLPCLLALAEVKCAVDFPCLLGPAEVGRVTVGN